jgi:hypothetical protein
MSERPAAIIVTFPRVFFREVSPRQFVRDFLGMNSGEIEYWICKMGNVPRIEVPYCYIVINNRIRYRANIAGFEPGGERTFDDGRRATGRAWMILTAPVIKAPYRIQRTGFQGFRYSDLIF